MKKLIHLLFCIVFCVGCNEKSDGPPLPYESYVVSEYIWENQSDHKITLSVERAFYNEGIEPGGQFMQQTGDFAFISISSFVRFGVRLVFDDGLYGGVFEYSVNPILHPNLQDENLYEYEESTGGNNVPISTWTYTFTNADYEAAVARGSMTE